MAEILIVSVYDFPAVEEMKVRRASLSGKAECFRLCIRFMDQHYFYINMVQNRTTFTRCFVPKGCNKNILSESVLVSFRYQYFLMHFPDIVYVLLMYYISTIFYKADRNTTTSFVCCVVC